MICRGYEVSHSTNSRWFLTRDHTMWGICHLFARIFYFGSIVALRLRKRRVRGVWLTLWVFYLFHCFIYLVKLAYTRRIKDLHRAFSTHDSDYRCIVFPWCKSNLGDRWPILICRDVLPFFFSRQKFLHLFHPDCKVIQLNCCCGRLLLLSIRLISFNFLLFHSLWNHLFLCQVRTDFINLPQVAVVEIVWSMLQRLYMCVITSKRVLTLTTKLFGWYWLWNRCMYNLILLMIIWVCFAIEYWLIVFSKCYTILYFKSLCHSRENRSAKRGIDLYLWYISNLSYWSNHCIWDVKFVARIPERLKNVILTFFETFLSLISKLN